MLQASTLLLRMKRERCGLEFSSLTSGVFRFHPRRTRGMKSRGHPGRTRGMKTCGHPRLTRGMKHAGILVALEVGKHAGILVAIEVENHAGGWEKLGFCKDLKVRTSTRLLSRE